MSIMQVWLIIQMRIYLIIKALMKKEQESSVLRSELHAHVPLRRLSHLNQDPFTWRLFDCYF